MKSDSIEKNIIIYCDGACLGNPGPGGWGFCFFHPLTFEVLEKGGSSLQDTTNNQMELKAAIEALTYCREQKIKLPIIIRTDSQYVIKGITEWINNWIRHHWKTSQKKPVLNQELWRELLAVSKDLNLI